MAYLKSLLLCASFAYVAAGADAIRIQFNKAEYHLQEHVTATIFSSGKVTIENDVAAASMQLEIQGSKEVDLGVLNKPGFYSIRVLGSGGNFAVAMIVVSQDKQQPVYCATATATQAPPPDSGLIGRLVDGLTKKRMEDAAKSAFPKWLNQNIASLGTTTTVCMVCVVPGGQVGCPVCASSAGGNAIDLALAILEECVSSMERDKKLTQGEAKTLKLIIKSGGLAKILKADERIKKILEGIAFTIDVVVEEANAKMLLKGSVDEAKKANLLIEVLKKVP